MNEDIETLEMKAVVEKYLQLFKSASRRLGLYKIY